MKCDKCGGERFSLVASRISGKDKLIDVYLCMTCQHSKQVIIETNKEESYPVDVPIPDLDNDGDFDYETLDDASNERDPFDNNDGGWDPSIG
jgi:protein-arginine kinase activator protein McsA